MSRPRLRTLTHQLSASRSHPQHPCIHLRLATRNSHHARPSSTSTSTWTSPPALPQPLQSRIRWSYLWYISILSLGLATGLGARHFAAPLGLVEPGSHADAVLLESLSKDVDALPVVKELRDQAMNLRMGKAREGGAEGEARKPFKVQGWLEVPKDFLTAAPGVSAMPDPSEQLAEESQTVSGTGAGILGAMSGARGLGVQRAFWNAETREMVAVVWIGGGLAGWPGVCHGGAIATLFGEVMGRMAGGVGERLVADAGMRGGEGAGVAHPPPPSPTSLTLTYKKPTHTLDFYVLRAAFSDPLAPQLEEPSQSEAAPSRSWFGWFASKKDVVKTSSEEVEIEGTLEGIGGQVCVKAKAVFGGDKKI